MAHGIALAIAMLQDQMRMQPQVFSLLLLMVGTLPAAGAQLAGRMHLVSLWIWSGLHKLFSPGYYLDVIPQIVGSWLPGDSWQALTFGVLLAGCELMLGILAMVPGTRPLAALLGVVLHLSVFAWLSPLGINWNESVWGWNLALAVAAWLLIGSWREKWALERVRVGILGRVAAIILLLSPAGYYVGAVDAYLAYCLYSGNTMWGFIQRDRQYVELPQATFEELHVPIPPAHRTFRAFFKAMARKGDRLQYHDPRAYARWAGCDEVTIEAP
jgi:hypothetical protein